MRGLYKTIPLSSMQNSFTFKGTTSIGKDEVQFFHFFFILATSHKGEAHIFFSAPSSPPHGCNTVERC